MYLSMSKVEIEFSWFSFVFGGNKALGFFIIISFNNSFLSLHIFGVYSTFICSARLIPASFPSTSYERTFEHIWAYDIQKIKLWHQHNNMQFRGQKNKSQILEQNGSKRWNNNFSQYFEITRHTFETANPEWSKKM